MKTGPSNRSERSHPLARNIKFWTLREQSTFYHITVASVTLLAQVFMLPVLARNYGQRFPDLAGQPERRESLRLASPIWKWRRAPSFCCGHIISSRPPPPSHAMQRNHPRFLLLLFPCFPARHLPLSHPSTHPLVSCSLIVFVFFPPTVSCRKAGTTCFSCPLWVVST